jgi:hypothetical protein
MAARAIPTAADVARRVFVVTIPHPLFAKFSISPRIWMAFIERCRHIAQALVGIMDEH